MLRAVFLPLALFAVAAVSTVRGLYVIRRAARQMDPADASGYDHSDRILFIADGAEGLTCMGIATAAAALLALSPQ